ncbi:LysR family transcriptional regulator [Jeotgalibacillus sp. ET6]|uniref:LysR family transcriptional regulator n=1 Tax=Jeotgalibacillus sp. ET6 TaxID=3037260 RepID=UPI0024188BCB|nr:LysR family transcriptional regulator [Jeotgalibacillus sp. ET6]MDG5472210.1 LysR family transcriptional regulator [Jeotgalibacillus sp. ET6]
MNISWLRTFITAASCENFHQTAELLYLSQPTVTVHIKQLEKETGIRLFQRKGRVVRLTPAGKTFLHHAKSILLEVEKGQKKMEQFRQGYKKTLILAVSPLIASAYLPYWVNVYMKENPQVEVIIKVVESNLISEEIEKGSADLGLSRQATSLLGLTCEKLYSEPLAVVVPHDGDERENAAPLDLEEIIEDYYLITHNHPEYWEEVLLKMKSLFPFIRTMKISQVHVTKRFIEERIGFSVLPRSIVRRELAEGRVLEVFTEKELNLPLSATYLVQRDGMQEGDAFLQVVRRLI